MSEYTLRVERVEEGYVRVAVLSTDEMTGSSVLLWACDVNQYSTKSAQKAALKATLNYLIDSIDLT